MRYISNRAICLTKSAITVTLSISAMSLSATSLAETVTKAITNGQTSADIRVRYESVKQNNASKDATATTIRTRLGYRTAEYKHFSLFAEMEGTSTLMGKEDYNSTQNGQTGYSTIKDPSGYEMNQATLGYSGISDTTFILGRQRTILDNARFIGNVGWRQNEQTLDAAVIKNRSLPDTVVTYAYVDNVNQITTTDLDVKAHIVNINYSGFGFGRLSGYSYLLDFTDKPDDSQKTLGLRFNGSADISANTKLLYTAEYATQKNYKDGSSNIDANYTLIEFGARFNGFTAKLGYEVLGANGKNGNDGYGFSTPLATKHAFNGWADQFTTTPKQGLQDSYLSIGTKISGIKLLAVYHSFATDEGNTDLGTEINLLAVKKFGKHYTALLKYASFSAKSGGGKDDTDKLWLQGQLKF